MFFLLESGLWHHLEKWDQQAFILINGGTVNPFFDAVLPFMRNSLNWAPLYVFLIMFALINFRSTGLWWVLFMLGTVALTDMTGTYVFKHGFERIRPCGDPDFYMNVRLLVDHCSSGHSFTSNHAANHFGIATFFYFTTRKWLKGWAVTGLVWAGIISYAQVYVGVHYPLDIIGGTIVGLVFGTLTSYLFNKRYGFAIFDNQPTLTS